MGYKLKTTFWNVFSAKGFFFCYFNFYYNVSPLGKWMSSLVSVIACRKTGYMSLQEPMLTNSLTHIFVTRFLGVTRHGANIAVSLIFISSSIDMASNTTKKTVYNLRDLKSQIAYIHVKHTQTGIHLLWNREYQTPCISLKYNGTSQSKRSSYSRKDNSLMTVWHLMTSSNGNIFRVTGLLWGEFTGDRWIPLTKASDVELFVLSAPEQTVEQASRRWWFETLSRPLWRHRNDIQWPCIL